MQLTAKVKLQPTDAQVDSLKRTAEKIALRLTERYSKARIAEKIAYLAFLQQEQPDKVQNPRGWLRRAIEENYGPPDGFVTAAERERRKAEAAAKVQREEVGEQQQRSFAAQRQAQQEAWRQQLRERYGTSDKGEQLWEEVRSEFKHSQPQLYQLLMRGHLLTCTEDYEKRLAYLLQKVYEGLYVST
jgi:hypothetical protein